jgi:hypothetical protein
MPVQDFVFEADVRVQVLEPVHYAEQMMSWCHHHPFVEKMISCCLTSFPLSLALVFPLRDSLFWAAACCREHFVGLM